MFVCMYTIISTFWTLNYKQIQNCREVLTDLNGLILSPQEILKYSNTSAKGKDFISYLTDLSIQATLFAPSNDGINENVVSDHCLLWPITGCS